MNERLSPAFAAAPVVAVAAVELVAVVVLEPAVPTTERSAPAGCRQPVTVMVESSRALLSCA
jgi:hypothetical protein